MISIFKIAICDKDQQLCGKLEMGIISNSKSIGAKIDIQVYLSGEELLKVLRDGEYFDIILVDFHLMDKKGNRIGKSIETELKQEKVCILYTAAKDQEQLRLISEGLPIHVLFKPFSEFELFRSVQKCMEQCEQSKLAQQYYLHKHRGEYYKIPYADILYFLTDVSVSKMVTKHTTQIINKPLIKIYEELKDHGFCFSDRSCLINFQHIEVLYTQDVKLQGVKECLPVSRVRHGELEKRLRQQEAERLFRDELL